MSALLDELKVPTGDSLEDYQTCISIMDKCKKYYADLLDAKRSNSGYIISFQHAIDSLDYALKQYNLAEDELTEEIEDPNKDTHLQAIRDSKQEINDIKEILLKKTSELEKINSDLKSYLERTLSINERADNKRSSLMGKY